MRYIAVIDLGSTAIRLSVMEISEDEQEQQWRVLESAEKMIGLGQDIFEDGVISPASIEQVISHIIRFQELYSLYHVEDVFLLGSYAIREAENRELFQDRIQMETGLAIRVLGGMETNQLRYLALSRTLETSDISLSNHHSLILDIGSSSTEVMYLKKGKMTWSDTLQVGILRDTSKMGLSPDNWGEDLGEHIRTRIHRILLQFAEEYDLQRVNQVILMGRDIQSAAPYMGEKLSEGCLRIQGEDFFLFLNKIKSMSLAEIMERFGLNYHKAVSLLPALHIGANIFQFTAASQLIVPPASALDGVFMQFASSPEQLKRVFKEQILASAWSLAKHYHSDLKHADYVREKAMLIYRFICEKKQLRVCSPIILETAAILHDIGSFISGSSHHKHGQYLVNNSPIFGLNAEQKEWVGHIVRYHRKAKPKATHRAYMSLSREARIQVQQLSAVLRVADALDRSHQQHLDFSMTMDENRLVLHCKGHPDLALAKESLQQKSDLMQDIFGLKILIR